MYAGCLDGDVAAADGGKHTAVCRCLGGSTQQSADASTRWVLKIDPTFKEHAYCSMNEIQGQ